MRELKLEIKNLFKIYKRGSLEVMAVNGISERFYTGEIIAIFGPSGSGKSTLLNLIGALDEPSMGEIFFYPANGEKQYFNEDVLKIHLLKEEQLSVFRNKCLGFVFQFFNLLPHLTAFENIEYPMLVLKNKEQDRKKKIVDLLEKVGLSGKENKYPEELSGGEQQRVAICISLANNPSLLLADEPTGELDSSSAQRIIDLFKKLQSDNPQLLTIIVSHNEIVKQIATRVLIMKDGNFS